jgi:hypothetical protein
LLPQSPCHALPSFAGTLDKEQRKLVCTNLRHMPVEIVRNEVPQKLQESVARGIFSALGSRRGLWEVDIASELKANAWDVEVFGPNNFHWARRFSGGDRDPDVISEAIRSAVLEKAA